MPEYESLSPRARRTELLWALCLSLLLGGIVVGRPLWNSNFVYLATDTATVQAPWSVEGGAPENRELSDSAVAFYPHYRRVSQSWRAGEAPLWNGDIYAGVPLLANAQWGALDPQVLALVGLDALGGERALDLGFAWMALLRIAAAALGAYLLARCMGLSALAAALAGSAFSLSGSLTLWLGFSLSHVTPLLPWVLLGIEGLRSGRRLVRSFVVTAFSMALAIYAGHPEVAFFVGLSAGVWTLSLFEDSRRAAVLALAALACGVLLAAPILLPFVEYLKHSGTLLAHQLAPSARQRPDLIPLGALMLFIGFLWKWRGAASNPALTSKRFGPFVTALPIVLAWLGVCLVLSGRGVELDLGLARSASIEAGSSRIPVPALGLVLAAIFSCREASRRARWSMALGSAAWLLALRAPGVVDLWRWVPLVGLAAPERIAGCAALWLALVAGTALDRSTATARWAAVLSLLALGALMHWRAQETPLDPSRAGLDTGDEIVTYSQRPPRVLREGNASLAGLLHGGLDLDELRMSFEKLGATGELLERAGFERVATLGDRSSTGARAFDFGELELRALGLGEWRLKLEFRRAGEVIGERRPALVRIPRANRWSRLGLLLAGCTAVALLLPARRFGSHALVLLTLANGVALARDWNPAVPRARHFQPTRTGEFLSAHFAGERVLCAPGIFPGDTLMLTRAATIGGYDAMDVASFDGYRAFALLPGRNPLLDWNTDGMNLASPAFRLFGVRALLLHSRRALPGWTLVAGPEGAPQTTEVYVYRADDPLPRAFCVETLVKRTQVLAHPEAFDPRHTAFLEGSFTFEFEAPFRTSVVRPGRRSQRASEYEVELDGEGLFLCTEQHFPGWRVSVDGAPRELLRVNSIFRGVVLGPGTHAVRFEYEPDSWKYGRWLGALALALTVLLAFVAGRARSGLASTSIR